MLVKSPAWSLIPALLLCGWLAGAAPAAGEVSRQPDSPTLPAHPRILEAAQAPRTARILRQVALTYAPQMSERDREIDFLQKVTLAKRLLGVGRLLMPSSGSRESSVLQTCRRRPSYAAWAVARRVRL